MEEKDGAREGPAWASWRNLSTDDLFRGNGRPSEDPELSRSNDVLIGVSAGFWYGVFMPEIGGDDSEDEVPEETPGRGGEPASCDPDEGVAIG